VTTVGRISPKVRVFAVSVFNSFKLVAAVIIARLAEGMPVDTL
jgi:hypothetical protein